MTNITIADSTTFYRPVLELYEDGKVHRNKDIISEIREILPDDEKDSDKVKTWVERPINHFSKAGVLERVNQAGHYRITEDGRKFLNLDEDSLHRSILYKYCPKWREYKDSFKNETPFDNTLKNVKELLEDLGTPIDGDYDMLLIKKLPLADIIPENKPNNPGHNTHIALTNEKMDIFPFLESFDYFYKDKGQYDTKSKSRFLLEVPVELYSSNLNYLNIEEKFGHFEENQQTSVTILRRRMNNSRYTIEKFIENYENFEQDEYEIRNKFLGYDVQVELSSEKSGQAFKDFRKLLYKDYFLIILKHNSEFKYDIFSILPDDGEDILPNFELYTTKKKTITMVSTQSVTIDFSSNETEDQDRDKLWTVDVDLENIETNGENILFYGVPGVGKSWHIKNVTCKDVDEKHMERVVFHQDYTYSDFIGQILPKEDENKVKYEFSKGPFTSILTEACAHPNEKYYLIIEEINRGNAPAIFGDVFQLLDRKTKEENDDLFPEGTSEYGISNPEIAYEVYKNKNNKVRIPPNLTIIATMNTADQNVFTLDTAFQRRWKMRLIPNKFKDHKYADKKILDTTVSWKQFVKYINDLILKKNTLMTSSEDKRLGVYFVKEEDLEENDENGEPNKKFAEKVLKYLWDDAFKFSRTDLFNKKYNSLEDVICKFNSLSENDRFDIFKNKQDLIDFTDSEDTNE